jgi:hypothetical protein
VRELLVDIEPSDPKDWTSGIGNWFIDAPGQSPAWRHYMLSAVHLRPIDGVKPAMLKEPGMTHEFMLMAMDPEKKPDPQNPETWSYLRPHNLAEQVTVHNDATASKLLDLCATTVAEGRLWAEPALSGQVEPWRSFLRHWAKELSANELNF